MRLLMGMIVAAPSRCTGPLPLYAACGCSYWWAAAPGCWYCASAKRTEQVS